MGARTAGEGRRPNDGDPRRHDPDRPVADPRLPATRPNGWRVSGGDGSPNGDKGVESCQSPVAVRRAPERLERGGGRTDR